ncbi:hypothetical protein M5585_19600 [Serratia ureilytica]
MERLLYRLFMTSEGIFGITLSTASTAIVVFILFGAFSASAAQPRCSTIWRWPPPDAAAAARPRWR